MKQRVVRSSPANTWDVALPIGNGRLGALIRGIPGNEIIHLNEETIWYGGPNERLGPDAPEAVARVRDLLAAGEVEEADYQTLIGMYSSPKYLTPFQPAGELRLHMRQHQGKITNYRAELDLESAVATITYDVDGVHWKREHIASRGNGVIAIRITNSIGSVSLGANLMRRPFEEFSQKLDDETTGLWGQSGVGGVHYFGGLTATAGTGTVQTVNDFVTIEQAEEAVLYLTFETDFNGKEDYREQALERLVQAKEEGFATLLERHISEYQSLFQRMNFSLGGEVPEEQSTAEALAQVRQGTGDYLALTENLFHFGRYLMICGSTNCQLPLTLQGIWNGDYTPRWESKYTININIQMNYWPAGPCALPECHLPLFDLVDRMVVRGQKTAKNLYGCEGFVAHHNTSIWADTDPEGIPVSAPVWPMGGAWLALHFYDQYDYTGDLCFLKKRALPVLEEAIRFFSGYMVHNDEGYLVTGPSLSPENTYITADGKQGTICMGPTMDIQIVRQLLKDYLAGCDALGEKPALYSVAENMLGQLPPTKLTADGRIAEWQEDYDELEPGHRHMSHLFGLYPGNEITDVTPELMDGARKTIAVRLANGGGHTGWSRAWIICLLARLQEGELAYQHVKEMLHQSVLENLFNTHPPFQIDGNFGFTAAIAEMVVQSHEGFVRLLPAVPAEWATGSMEGIILRGSISATIRWDNGVLTECTLTSFGSKQEVLVVYRNRKILVPLKQGESVSVPVEELQ